MCGLSYVPKETNPVSQISQCFELSLLSGSHNHRFLRYPAEHCSHGHHCYGLHDRRDPTSKAG